MKRNHKVALVLAIGLIIVDAIVILVLVFDKRKSAITVSSSSTRTTTTIKTTTSTSTKTTTTTTTTTADFSNTAIFLSSVDTSDQRICPDSLCSGRFHYVDPILIEVPLTGNYTITSASRLDTYAYLYQSPFDIRFLTFNYMMEHDDFDITQQFRLQTILYSQSSYVVLVSTFQPNTTGEYRLIGTGPGRLNFSQLTNLKPLTFPVIFNYSSVLDFNSSRSCSNDTCSNFTHYYQTVSFIVTTDGRYFIASDSRMRTYGLFYNSTFNPLNPRANFVADNQSGSNNGQFLLIVDLQRGVNYTVVVTTSLPNQIGPFVLIFYGPGNISII